MKSERFIRAHNDLLNIEPKKESETYIEFAKRYNELIDAYNESLFATWQVPLKKMEDEDIELYKKRKGKA